MQEFVRWAAGGAARVAAERVAQGAGGPLFRESGSPGWRLRSPAVSGCSARVPQPRQAASQWVQVAPRWNEGKSKRETRGKARAGRDLRSDIQTCAGVIRCLTFVSGATAESCFHERSVLGDVEICEIDSLDKLCA